MPRILAKSESSAEDGSESVWVKMHSVIPDGPEAPPTLWPRILVGSALGFFACFYFGIAFFRYFFADEYPGGPSITNIIGAPLAGIAFAIILAVHVAVSTWVIVPMMRQRSTRKTSCARWILGAIAVILWATFLLVQSPPKTLSVVLALACSGLVATDVVDRPTFLKVLVVFLIAYSSVAVQVVDYIGTETLQWYVFFNEHVIFVLVFSYPALLFWEVDEYYRPDHRKVILCNH